MSTSVFCVIAWIFSSKFLHLSVVCMRERKSLLEVQWSKTEIISSCRIIYWTDWGAHPKIEKSNYDGTNRQTLVDSGLKFPNGLVYDGTSKHSLLSVTKTKKQKKTKTTTTIRYYNTFWNFAFENFKLYFQQTSFTFAMLGPIRLK